MRRVAASGVDPLARQRRRLVMETELALLIGLRFPERYPRIPRIEVGKGCFRTDRAFAFWSKVLDMGEEEYAELRDMLTGGPAC